MIPLYVQVLWESWVPVLPFTHLRNVNYALLRRCNVRQARVSMYIHLFGVMNTCTSWIFWKKRGPILLELPSATVMNSSNQNGTHKLQSAEQCSRSTRSARKRITIVVSNTSLEILIVLNAFCGYWKKGMVLRLHWRTIFALSYNFVTMVAGVGITCSAISYRVCVTLAFHSKNSMSCSLKRQVVC